MIVISKRFNKIIIVFALVIAITILLTFNVFAAGSSDYSSLVNFQLIAYDSNFFNPVIVEASSTVELVGDDLLVTIRPKDQLEFLIMIDKGYEFDLSFDIQKTSYNHIIFNNLMPITFVSSSEEEVSPFVYRSNTIPELFEYHSCMFNFTAFSNMSEFSFALSENTSFDFSAPPDPPNFMVFLSDVVILFENSLDWFNYLFSNVSKHAPLLILVCGFAIVGFSFSLLRRVQR